MIILPLAVRRGFTLFEVVITLAITGIIIKAIFSLADSTMGVTNTLVETQTDQLTQNAFFKLMDDHFQELPGNCRMNLTFTDTGRHYLSDMTFQNVPTSFSWGGRPIESEAMRITTRPDAEGGLSVVLSYFDQLILELGERPEDQGIEPVAEIVLLEEVHLFEWRVLNGSTREWQWDWKAPSSRPLQVELVVVFGGEDTKIRRVFWIPGRKDPRVHQI